MGAIQSTADTAFRSAVDFQTGGRPLTAQSGLENIFARTVTGDEWNAFMDATSDKSNETGKWDIDQKGVSMIKLKAHPLTNQLYTDPQSHAVMFRPFTDDGTANGFCGKDVGGQNACEFLQAPPPSKYTLAISKRRQDALVAGNKAEAAKLYNTVRTAYEIELYDWYKNYLLLRDTITNTSAVAPLGMKLGCQYRDMDGNTIVGGIAQTAISALPGATSGQALCNAEAAYARGDQSTFFKEYNYAGSAALMDGALMGTTVAGGVGANIGAAKFLGLGGSQAINSGALNTALTYGKKALVEKAIDTAAKKTILGTVGADQGVGGYVKRTGANSTADKLGLPTRSPFAITEDGNLKLQNPFATTAGDYLQKPTSTGWTTTDKSIIFDPPSSTSSNRVTITPIDDPPASQAWA